MDNINELIVNVQSSRKRSGIVYCSGSFNPIIKQFQDYNPEFELFDCTKLYRDTLIFSASDLLNQIENMIDNKTAIITNLESFIVPNSHNFSEQLAKLLIVREPLKPIYFLFYSHKIYRQFKDQFEAKELNRFNTLEL